MPLTSTHRSSGDLRADRRYEYARAAFDESDSRLGTIWRGRLIRLGPYRACSRPCWARGGPTGGGGEEAVDALRQALTLGNPARRAARILRGRARRVPDEARRTHMGWLCTRVVGRLRSEFDIPPDRRPLAYSRPGASCRCAPPGSPAAIRRYRLGPLTLIRLRHWAREARALELTWASALPSRASISRRSC